ncbi:MAG: acyltransferase family protein [bacterium]
MTTGSVVKKERRYDIDWLRVLAVLLLFFYHPARIFSLWDGWYIENAEKSLAISIVATFTNHWHMALLFLLAGASTYFALGFRSSRRYVTERFKRLLVPLVFGLLVVVPPQIYISLLHNHKISSHTTSYWEFYPDYFTSRYTGSFDMGHLWFIAYLFAFSLVCLPLFLYLRRESGQRLLGRLAGFFSHPGMIFTLAIPVMVANYLLLHFYPNLIYYLVFFFYGYILVADTRFEDAIAKFKELALIFGVVLYIAWISLVRLGVISGEWLQPIPHDLIAWCCLIAILGYGKQFLGFTNKFLKYAGEASYPMYILHQTVIIFIAYFVVQWNLGPLFKYAIIVVASLAATTLVYDLLVKRFNLTRFLFGMRLKKNTSTGTKSVIAPAKE